MTAAVMSLFLQKRAEELIFHHLVQRRKQVWSIQMTVRRCLRRRSAKIMTKQSLTTLMSFSHSHRFRNRCQWRHGLHLSPWRQVLWWILKNTGRKIKGWYHFTDFVFRSCRRLSVLQELNEENDFSPIDKVKIDYEYHEKHWVFQGELSENSSWSLINPKSKNISSQKPRQLSDSSLETRKKKGEV